MLISFQKSRCFFFKNWALTLLSFLVATKSHCIFLQILIDDPVCISRSTEHHWETFDKGLLLVFLREMKELTAATDLKKTIMCGMIEDEHFFFDDYSKKFPYLLPTCLESSIFLFLDLIGSKRNEAAACSRDTTKEHSATIPQEQWMS